MSSAVFADTAIGAITVVIPTAATDTAAAAFFKYFLYFILPSFISASIFASALI